MTKVSFVMGEPCSGKSHFIREHLKDDDVDILDIYSYQQDERSNSKIFSYKRLKGGIGIVIFMERLLRANRRHLNDIIGRLKNGRNVVAEQTFHKAKRRIGYIEAMRETVDAEIEIYVMMPDDAQWEINLRAINDKRSVETAKRQTKEIEFPNPAEGFDRIYEVTGDRITLKMDTPAPEIIDKAKAELEEEKKKRMEELKNRLPALLMMKPRMI